MRLSLFVSSRSPQSRRVEEYLRGIPNHGIPIVRIETAEKKAEVKAKWPVTQVPTLVALDGEQMRLWVGFDKIIEFIEQSSQPPPRSEGRPTGGTSRPSAPRVVRMDAPVPRDDYPESDEELSEEEAPPPPPKKKKKTTVATPRQRKTAAKKLNELAEDEAPEEELSGRELAARKAAAAKRVKKPPSRMDDVVAAAKREQERARKSLPYKDKDFLA